MKIAPLKTWLPDLQRPLVIAGPCSAESEEQILQTAHAIKNIPGVRLFRAGIWKPRTRPNAFEGLGELALPWLAKVKQETGLLTTTEVATAKHVEACLKHNIDVLWIGARTAANPFSVQEIADALKGVDIPVMVKNPINADLQLWIGALERIAGAGVTKLAAIHRGFSVVDKLEFRNDPIWRIPMDLKLAYPDMPIICDPSHITGKRDLVPKVCQKAMDLDMDGLIIETHPTPEKAWSDAAQQVTPGMLSEIICTLKLKSEHSDDKETEQKLTNLRSQIDRIDNELIDILRSRQNVVEKIGEAKAQGLVTALQVHRREQLFKDRNDKALKLGLSPEYVHEIFDIIHDESVRVQTEIFEKSKK